MMPIKKKSDSYSDAESGGSWLLDFVGFTVVFAFFFAVRNMDNFTREIYRYNFAKEAPWFSADHMNPDAEQYPIVAVTGRVASSMLLGDDKFLLLGKYLQITRLKEVYAWVETSGDEICCYKKRWTSDFITPTFRFHEPKGHENTNLKTECITQSVPSFTVGLYCLSSENVKLPPPERLRLTPKNVSVQSPCVLVDNAIYNRTGSHASPSVGDERTSYTVVFCEGRLATVFGKIYDGTFVDASVPSVCADHKTTVLKDLFWGNCQDSLGKMKSLCWKFFCLAFFFMLVVVFLVFIYPFSEVVISIFGLGFLPTYPVIFFLLVFGPLMMCAAAYYLFLLDAPFFTVFVLVGVPCAIFFDECKKRSREIEKSHSALSKMK